jgi:hypothetical protein
VSDIALKKPLPPEVGSDLMGYVGRMMKPKTVVTWGLLLFVAASVVVLIRKEIGTRPTTAATPAGPSEVPTANPDGPRVIALPSVYGLGTGLPVFLFAVLIAVGAQRVGRAYNALTKFEKWARRVTGIVFIGLGIYESLRSIFGVV